MKRLQLKFSYSTLKNWLNVMAGFALLFNVLNPHLAIADYEEEPANIETPAEPEEKLPEKKPNRTMKAVITAYTSTPDQTDSSPFIAASGKRVHDGMIAANGLPFGTIIKIPSLYGDKEFIVEDRMNARYGLGRMDIWLDTTKKEALKFGVKRVMVEIYYPDKKK